MNKIKNQNTLIHFFALNKVYSVEKNKKVQYMMFFIFLLYKKFPVKTKKCISVFW